MISSAHPLPLRAGPPPVAVVAVMVVLAGFVTAFAGLLWGEWRQNPDLSHAFFVPLLFPFLLRESRRHGPPRWLEPGRLTALAGAGALLSGIFLFALAGLFAATLAWSHSLVGVLLAGSLAGFLLAGLLLLADERLRIIPCNWTSLTAIFLWLLVTPLPGGTYTRLTLALQHGVTNRVLQTLQLLGVPARQHGNLIELATTTVGVEEACSGIRSLVSCVFAGIFLAGWLVRHPLGRLLLIVAAPLLALGMNFLRSLTLTLLANSGTDISGFWHDATGYAILGVTTALLAGLAILLETKAEAPVTAEDYPPTSSPVWALRFFWMAFAAVIALGVFFFANAHPPERRGLVPPPLATLLPGQPAGWEVRTPNDLYQFAGVLRTTHLLERTYLRRSDPDQFTQFTVYLAYWAPGQTSVSQVASHTPDACWPGSGWTAAPVENLSGDPAVPGAAISPAEHRVFRNETGISQHVWFWHINDGHAIAYRDPYSVPALFQFALRYGFRKPGEQYFVRLSSNRPWAELKDEPLVQEILRNLARVGL